MTSLVETTFQITRKSARKTILQELPQGPGIYFFYNQSGIPVYVGKSKNLRRRLSQYFHAKRVKRHIKMRKILSDSVSLSYQTTSTHLEAEILETRTIQQLRPKWNVEGAFFFLYPLIGLRFVSGNLQICYTTQAEVFTTSEVFVSKEKSESFQFHGAFRSRYLTREAFFCFRTLLGYIGHREKLKTIVKTALPKYTHLENFRNVPDEWYSLLDQFWRGETCDILPELALALLENAAARKNSQEVQSDLWKLRRFFRLEARPLFQVRSDLGVLAYPVAQTERDILYLQFKSKKRRD